MSNGRIRVSWSDLPEELLEMIGKCLETETDILRFRAVCKSWRTARAPFKKFPSTPLRLPRISDSFEPCFDLVERIVYRFELPESRETNIWLAKVEKLSNGKLRIMNPVSDHQIEILPGIQMPKVLNTLDFRVSEVCKSYALKYVYSSESDEDGDEDEEGIDDDSDPNYCGGKVAVLANVETNEYAIMTIDFEKKLWYIKSGDEKWTEVTVDDSIEYFLDVVNYRGQFYGIDSSGGTWEFDSMFKANMISNNIPYRAAKRKLDLYNGELYLVEEVKRSDDGHPAIHMATGCRCPLRMFCRFLMSQCAEEIKIWRLNKEEGEWIQADMLNNRIIFAGDDCLFSVSGIELGGSKGTRVFYPSRCIFFQIDEGKKQPSYLNFERGCCSSCENIAGSDYYFIPSEEIKRRFSGLHGHNTCVCDFEAHKMGSLLKFPEYADIFWPPPSWLTS